jgi:MazG family protein
MTEIERLLQVMARLRDPVTGCPWDRAQTYATIVPYTLEEAYEVADAIDRDDRQGLKKELGDLLFQVVFYAQLAREEDAFTFQDVVTAVTEKMVHRHPHVFGEVEYADQAEQSAAWERLKRAEQDADPGSQLDGVPRTLPAMTRAIKLQHRAAQVGFDWAAVTPVLDKMQEELTEIRAALESADPVERVKEEVGDFLFAALNLARHLKVDPESALRATNNKFEKRFRYIEARLSEAGRPWEHSSLAEMDALWEQAKAAERD